MKFKLNKNTSPELIDLIYAGMGEADKEHLHELVLKRYGLSSFAQMKIGDFLNFCNGDFSKFFEEAKANSFDYVFVLAFKTFIEKFTIQMESLQVPKHLLSDDEESINKKLLQLSFSENILIFMQKFFLLKSFEEVAEMRIFELILAKKNQYNEDLKSALFAHKNKTNLNRK